jgi:hypothetical protein
MRKVVLFILCSAMVVGGLYAVFFDLLYASVILSRLLFCSVFIASIGGYLLWTDFIAPSLGIKSWED